jgi:hypothetical protein
MTKTKAFLSVFGVIAAEGEVETRGNKMGMPNKAVRGSATMRATNERDHVSP